MKPESDGADLLKHGLLFALFIVGWFGPVSLSHHLWLQIGLGGIALYYRCLQKRKTV